MDGVEKKQLAWILSKCHVDNEIMLTALSLGELITFIHKHYSNLKHNEQIVAAFLSENQANNSGYLIITANLIMLTSNKYTHLIMDTNVISTSQQIFSEHFFSFF